MKPKLAVRPRLNPVAVEKFVIGVESPAVQEPERLSVQASGSELRGPGLVQRQSGKVRRRMTVYLPPELAKSLMVRAAEKGEEASELVSAALTQYLGLCR